MNQDGNGRDGMDVLGIAVLIALALFYLSSLGCAHRREYIERDQLMILLYPSHGKCFFWDGIENERMGHTSCSERRTINGYSVVCNRKLGHRRAHHMHGADDCYWIW